MSDDIQSALRAGEVVHAAPKIDEVDLHLRLPVASNGMYLSRRDAKLGRRILRGFGIRGTDSDTALVAFFEHMGDGMGGFIGWDAAAESIYSGYRALDSKARVSLMAKDFGVDAARVALCVFKVGEQRSKYSTPIPWSVEDILNEMPNQPKTPLRSFRIPDDEYNAAKTKASAEGKTVTEVVRAAIRDYTSPARKDGQK